MIKNTDIILITGGSGFIGTNLIDLLILKEYTIINFDKNPPLNKNHESYWRKGNLLNSEEIHEAIVKYKPSIIIHLAARTDTLSIHLDDYIDNTKGTENLLNSIKQVTTIERVIITSTQYVYKCDNQQYPQSDTDYKPHTTYGQSKVITEELTHKADLNCTWTIIRPTNIWGPWHMRYPIELWKMIDKGLYVHPSKNEVIRTYGYVKNIVHQIEKIMTADVQLINKKMFYLGDLPVDSYQWLNTISMQLKQKKIRRIPTIIFTYVALIGDILIKLGVSVPIYSVRVKNMIEDYPAPTAKTINLFGVSHPDMKHNVNETIQWIKMEGKQFFEYWSTKY